MRFIIIKQFKISLIYKDMVKKAISIYNTLVPYS